MTLSPTLETMASMTRDEAHYWGSEVYQRVGDRVYQFYDELTSIGPDLRRALNTVWKSLKFADDIVPIRRANLESSFR